MSIRNLPGGVPEPHELFGRQHLIEVLWRQLEGNNILLVAPRRFGKTGVMRHVLLKPREEFLPVYLEVEDLTSPEDFATELLAATLEMNRIRRFMVSVKGIPKSLLDFLKEHIDELGSEEFKLRLRKAVGDSWKTIAKRLILEMERMEETVLFIVDEFPQMIDNISRKQGEEAARSVLSWFRSLRLKQKDELRHFRFVIAGSTSVDMILRRLNAPDKLNDFFRLPVEALESEDAHSLLDALAESYDLRFSEDSRRALFRLIGPAVPYFIHLLVSQLLLEPRLKGKELTAEDVEAVYTNRLLGPTCHKYFDFYRQRLKRYGIPGERSAVAILRAIADDPDGRVAESSLYDVYRKARKRGDSEVEFREIMADLECDWYVSLDTSTNEYFFFLEVMRAWWKRYYHRIGSPMK